MQEAPEQMHERLLEVIAKSQFEVLPQPYGRALRTPYGFRTTLWPPSGMATGGTR